MDFQPLLAFAALLVALINFGRYLSGRDWNAAMTQLTAWLAGVVVMILASETDWASGIDVAGVPLGSLNTASLILLGFTVASTGSVIVEFKKAIDTTDSAKKPDLFG